MNFRSVLLVTVPLAAVALFSSSAQALDQSKHRALSRDACAKVGLPWDFCERVGTEAYNVDHFEWFDMAAHAQVDVEQGQTKCEAANLAAARVRSIGASLGDAIAAVAADDDDVDGTKTATLLGRALHTIQDNCAHRGVSNPHHAWLSLSDSCEGTKSSPDARPEALECATRETAEIVAAFASALDDADVDFDVLDDGVSEGKGKWPLRGDICEFLQSGNSWDGVDDHWNSAVAVSALRDQFAAALAGTAVSEDVCAGNPNALSATPDASIDTSMGQEFCLKIDLFCIGKDDAPDEAPPWQDPAEAAADNEGTPPEQGCTVGGQTPPLTWSGLFVLALVARRRRAA